MSEQANGRMNERMSISLRETEDLGEAEIDTFKRARVERRPRDRSTDRPTNGCSMHGSLIMMTQYLDYTSCSVRRGREGGSTMLCQYLAVFGRDDHDDDAICSGQKLKGGRESAGGERGREGGTARTDRSSSI